MADKICIVCKRVFYTYGDTCLTCLSRQTRAAIKEETCMDDKTLPSKICIVCGGSFVPASNAQKTCNECKDKEVSVDLFSKCLNDHITDDVTKVIITRPGLTITLERN